MGRLSGGRTPGCRGRGFWSNPSGPVGQSMRQRLGRFMSFLCLTKWNFCDETWLKLKRCQIHMCIYIYMYIYICILTYHAGFHFFSFFQILWHIWISGRFRNFRTQLPGCPLRSGLRAATLSSGTSSVTCSKPWPVTAPLRPHHYTPTITT